MLSAQPKIEVRALEDGEDSKFLPPQESAGLQHETKYDAYDAEHLWIPYKLPTGIILPACRSDDPDASWDCSASVRLLGGSCLEASSQDCLIDVWLASNLTPCEQCIPM